MSLLRISVIISKPEVLIGLIFEAVGLNEVMHTDSQHSAPHLTGLPAVLEPGTVPGTQWALSMAAA